MKEGRKRKRTKRKQENDRMIDVPVYKDHDKTLEENEERKGRQTETKRGRKEEREKGRKEEREE